MAHYFFTGGIMPSVELLPKAAKGFNLVDQWMVNGVHYSKTLEAWLKKQDRHEKLIKEQFQKTYGKDTPLWIQRWRIFYLACSELFAFKQGEEWFVMHYLFSKKS
jgi:cyclopropane-fatty-acyl-phospholipid synthase